MVLELSDALRLKKKILERSVWIPGLDKDELYNVIRHLFKHGYLYDTLKERFGLRKSQLKTLELVLPEIQDELYNLLEPLAEDFEVARNEVQHYICGLQFIDELLNNYPVTTRYLDPEVDDNL